MVILPKSESCCFKKCHSMEHICSCKHRFAASSKNKVYPCSSKNMRQFCSNRINSAAIKLTVVYGAGKLVANLQVQRWLTASKLRVCIFAAANLQCLKQKKKAGRFVTCACCFVTVELHLFFPVAGKSEPAAANCYESISVMRQRYESDSGDDKNREDRKLAQWQRHAMALRNFLTAKPRVWPEITPLRLQTHTRRDLPTNTL